MCSTCDFNAAELESFRVTIVIVQNNQSEVHPLRHFHGNLIVRGFLVHIQHAKYPDQMDINWHFQVLAMTETQRAGVYL
jgi:hypothetical protein